MDKIVFQRVQQAEITINLIVNFWSIIKWVNYVIFIHLVSTQQYSTIQSFVSSIEKTKIYWSTAPVTVSECHGLTPCNQANFCWVCATSLDVYCQTKKVMHFYHFYIYIYFFCMFLHVLCEFSCIFCAFSCAKFSKVNF